MKEETRDAARYGAAEPGLGMTGAQYLTDIGVVAVGGDTWGLEAIPFEEGVGVFEVHHCLLYTSPSPRDLSTSRMPSSA